MPEISSMQEIMESFTGTAGDSVQIPTGWSQGRAVYGGLIAAIAADAMANQLASPRPIRSFLGNFVAPAPEGDLAIKSEILREGRAVVQTRADILAGDQVCFAGSAAFGDDRPGVEVIPDKAAHMPARDSVPSMQKGVRPLPGFLDNFDIRWTGGGIPMSGSMDRHTSMWVRHRSDMDAFPIAKIISIADMPPPIILSHYDRPARASTMSWSIEFIVPPEQVQGDWFYLDFTLDAAAGGYSQQSGSIYSESGALVALSRQCMVYFE